MKSHLYVLIISCTVNCDWIEITPIENKKYIYDVKNLDQTTTANYESESIVKSPTDIITTPAYLSNEETLSDSDEDISEIGESTEIYRSNVNTEFLNSSNDYADADGENNADTILPFLKTIQNNLLNFKKAHKSKMSVLKHLRDHLLMNIKELVTNLWKPKISSEARGYEDDGHMDFPSNEGALMTIGFLTFAVFLIKLVIKLVHALKYKQQYYGTTTTTAASVVFLKRKKRDEEQEEITKILQYIEEF